MKKKIAILLPYKENYTVNNAGAASIWVKDYLKFSSLKKDTIVYGNLDKKLKPLTSNFKNIDITTRILSKNIFYTKELFKEYKKKRFSIIEIHNRPESLIYMIKNKVSSKLIFVFHNNPQDMRGSTSINERIFLAENTDHIYFVSKWVKNKFFEGLPYKNRNNCEILYPAISELKKFPKKENLIIFCGKLNSSKGFDIFGKAVIKVLNSFHNWRAIAIGNEPREKYEFSHNNFKILDWVKHQKILNYYSKSSISVVPSKWQEPFGRTAMESAAHGCATITSNKGGLTETFENDLILDKLDVSNLFSLIKKLIQNQNLLKKIQKKNFQNVIHKLKDKVDKIDTLKFHFLRPKFHFIRKKNQKILHISQFDERNDFRLFNISIASKLSKGFIRNGHDVINLSYRNYISKNVLKNKFDFINQKIKSIVDNYRPSLIVLGHNNIISRNLMELIKNKHNIKISLWYEDALGHRGKGPNWNDNLKLIEKNNDLIDSYFTTTHPSEIKTSINKKKLNFLPIPVDENIENLKLYNIENKFKDLFFALSHGVNYGKLKKRKFDERETFINELMQKFPNVAYNILGMANENPKWNYDFYDELAKCKFALNLSRGLPIKYTSSNRIASLVGNGIYTFVDKKTKLNDFFNENEVGTYSSINELGSKIENLLSKPKLINKYAENGYRKYFKLFNNKLITKKIIDLTF
ncbi:glycosyltransferase [Candidatus Pelagibacter sp.]|nr:glycosyltransferase [Candidatus Pelagibacter sp.]